MAASARAWSVAKLKELHFEGDAEALGQYIDAVIEINRDSEGSDPSLLRSQVAKDLKDFLAESDAFQFVEALMRHLFAQNDSSPDQPTTQNAQTPSTSKPHVQTPVRPSHLDEKLRQPLTEPHRRSPRHEHRDASRDRAPMSASETERRDRSDTNQRRADRIDRRNTRQTVMQRLGDRMEYSKESKRQQVWDSKPSLDSRDSRQPQRPVRDRDRDRERDRGLPSSRGPRVSNIDIRDRLGARSLKRPREDSVEGRERRESDDNDTKFSRRVADAAHRRNDEYERQRPAEDRIRREDRPGRASPPRYEPNGKAPPPWPPGIVAQMGLMPPPFPLPPGMLPPVPPMVPGMGARLRGAFRGRDSVRPGTQNGLKAPYGASNNKHKHFILIAKFIPEDKMMIGPIYAFFQRFGAVKDVLRFPPDKAFILFQRREQAQAALSTVEAVMGNRHIKLHWARGSDFTEACLQLTDDGNLVEDEQMKKAGKDPEREDHPDSKGTEMSPTSPNRFSRADPGKDKPIRQTAVEKERKIREAEDDLKRKKEQIAELRRQQDKRIAELTKRKQQLLARQHEIFAKIPTANEEEKLTMKNELVSIQEETMQVQQELKPKAVTPTKPEAPKRFSRNQSVYKVDNRPKQVLVRGTNESIAVDSAVSAFRDTERAESLSKNEWLLTFVSRRAAESAVRAQKVLKRCFGPEATASIVNSSTLEASKANSAGGTDNTMKESSNEINPEANILENGVQPRSASAVAE